MACRTDTFVDEELASSDRNYNERIQRFKELDILKRKLCRIPETTVDIDAIDNGYNSGGSINGPISIHSREYFKQWKGRVIQIEDGDCFLAKIEALQGTDKDVKIVRFNRHKVDMINTERFQEGAIFYWTVGVFQKANKMMVKQSEIRFQLLNAPSPFIRKEMEDELGKVYDGISWLE